MILRGPKSRLSFFGGLSISTKDSVATPFSNEDTKVARTSNGSMEKRILEVFTVLNGPARSRTRFRQEFQAPRKSVESGQEGASSQILSIWGALYPS